MLFPKVVPHARLLFGKAFEKKVVPHFLFPKVVPHARLLFGKAFINNEVFDVNTGEKIPGKVFHPRTGQIVDGLIDGDDVVVGEKKLRMGKVGDLPNDLDEDMMYNEKMSFAL